MFWQAVLLFSHWLLRSDAPVQAARGQDAGRECGQKRSRSQSEDGDGETKPKHRRKRPSRWSDRPPSPPDGRGSAEGDRGRDAPVDRPPTDEPVVGEIYKGKVCSIMQFGCFVQLEGLRSVGRSCFSRIGVASGSTSDPVSKMFVHEQFRKKRAPTPSGDRNPATCWQH